MLVESLLDADELLELPPSRIVAACVTVTVDGLHVDAVSNGAEQELGL